MVCITGWILADTLSNNLINALRYPMGLVEIKKVSLFFKVTSKT
jgi:hypothetical protein